MRLHKPLFSLLLILGLAAAALAKDPVKLLPPHYRDWLTKDVTYIITNQEKESFLGLTTDDARDKFIEHFWDVRNPTPGSPDNTYKLEHYRRLEYANTFFGHASHTEGSRTDMGRVYITLGEPQQRQKLLGLQKITPMEIWFYSNANPALPPFFYVLFYQRDSVSEFKIYHPYTDGPEKLITSLVGPSRQQALKIISNDAGRDVARVTLSLLPDEPVDFEGGTISLQSDVMLSTVTNLANNPISQAELNNRRRLLEDVSHRVVLGQDYLDVTTVTLRDSAGNTNLHYVLRLKKAEDFTIGEAQKGGYYYSVLASAKVLTPEGKLVFHDEKKFSRNVSDVQFEQVKGKVFGYEGWLPLPPGKYKLDFQLSNLLSNTAFRRELEVAVPDPAAAGLQVSALVPFSDASMVAPETSGSLPFSSAGVRFVPMAGQELQFTQGQPVKFFYQVWDPGVPAEARAGKKLSVDYVYGRLGAQDTQTIHDEIPLEQLDTGGSVVNGKQIATGELQPGNYRLVMTIRDPESQAKVFGATTFGVTLGSVSPPAWDISDDKLADSIRNGSLDFQRASCYLASGDKVRAAQWLATAFTKSPGTEQYRNKLIELYFEQQKYPSVTELYAKGGLSEATDDQTIVRIAQSYEKAGELTKAIAVMESGTSLKPASSPLLLALADYYRKNGDLKKAATAEQKGKQLSLASPPS